jgi:hypothetical protein
MTGVGGDDSNENKRSISDDLLAAGRGRGVWSFAGSTGARAGMDAGVGEFSTSTGAERATGTQAAKRMRRANGGWWPGPFATRLLAAAWICAVDMPLIAPDEKASDGGNAEVVAGGICGRRASGAKPGGGAGVSEDAAAAADEEFV